MALSPPTGFTAAYAWPWVVSIWWTNGATYNGIQLERAVNGGGYSLLTTLAGSATTYADSSCQDGTYYVYRARGYTLDAFGEYTYSAYATASALVTPLPDPTGLWGSSTTSSITIYWTDNAQNETAYYVYMDGGLVATLGANATSHTQTGLTVGIYYQFQVYCNNSYVTSGWSNSVSIFVGDPPAKPTDLTATATATTKIRLNWTDNASNEVDYHIEQSSTSGSAGFAEITTVTANITTYEVTGLTTNTQYWFRVRAHNASGYSDYCTVATAVTFASIAAPTNLVCVAISGTVVDLYFDDNSSLEDDHRLERKTGAGAYSEIATLEPNKNCYRNTGLSAGTTYTYKVRAKQGASYSDYCTEVAVTTLDVPAAPTNLAISEYQDTWLRLTWTRTTGETGYKIEQSSTGAWGGEEVEIASIPDDISEYKVTGLTAGTHYHFRIRAYNGAGNSAYLSDVSQTTRSAFSFSTFQRLIRKSNPKLIYLVEINPLLVLSGWALTSGKTYTYEADFDERGAELDAVYENGVALTIQTSVANVESNAGSWYFDSSSKLIYVHPSGNDTANNYTYTGSFWLYFTNWSEGGSEIDFNGHCYIPAIAIDGIPDITQEIQPYYEGNFVITSGSLSLINGEINGINHFDLKMGRYLFLNRKVQILAGGDGFTYSQFEMINTGIIEDYTCTDRGIVFSLRDIREGINRTIPYSKYFSSEFASIDTNSEFKVRPFGYGVVTNAVPICIDTTNRIFEFHAGRIKSVEAVKQNGSTLTVNTDYFIDYQRGRVILARGLSYATDDIILVNFTGAVTSADETISTGAAIFKHILNNYLNVADAELDLDSIWGTHISKTTALVLYLWKEIDSQELIRRIERSIQADSFQDAQGRLGLKEQLSSAPSDIFYVQNAHVFDFAIGRSKDSIYSEVIIYYGENPSTDKWSSITKTNNSATFKHGVSRPLEIYTALSSSSDANTLASAIVSLLDKTTLSFGVKRSLFGHMPGDLIYFTRTRYFDSTGTANSKLMRILSISKGQSNGRTTITAEEV